MEENQKKEVIKNNIYIYLKEGMFKKDAAVMAGISEATLYRWLGEDKSFECQVEASILDYKHSLVKIINTCAEKDGRLALEVLSRRFPETDVRAEDAEDHERSVKQIADTLQQILHEGSEARPNGEMKTLPNGSNTDSLEV